MTKPRKSGIKQKFRLFVNRTAIKLKLRKVEASEKSRSMSPPKFDCEISVISEIDVQPVKKQDSTTTVLTKSERKRCAREKRMYREKTMCLKRYPGAGTNFSKIPILSEIPTTPNPAGWISSNPKTQKDTKPIKN